MFKRLFALLAPKPGPEPVDELEPDPHLIAEAAAHKEALAGFMRLVSRQLGEAESERLTANVLAQFDDGEISGGNDAIANFLYEGLLGDAGQQHGKWMMIQIDWKASDEIDWQVNEMLATRGIDDRWEWDSDGETVMQGLAVLDGWLVKRALSLLSVDFGHDAYYMLIVDKDVAGPAIELGRRAGLDVMSFPDFAVTQGEA